MYVFTVTKDRLGARSEGRLVLRSRASRRDIDSEIVYNLAPRPLKSQEQESKQSGIFYFAMCLVRESVVIFKKSTS
jgi:hypothetical protein